MRASAKNSDYHHGDLRSHLLEVAHKEIAQHGAANVSLSTLARLAGVSQAAPYRHFSSRSALLEAVAAKGFQHFSQRLQDAIRERQSEQALESLSVAYVQFGESNTEIYRLMFASRLTPEAQTGSDLDQVANDALQLLRTLVMTLPSASNWSQPEVEVYRIWAQLHGLVMLKADGFIERPLLDYVTVK